MEVKEHGRDHVSQRTTTWAADNGYWAAGVFSDTFGAGNFGVLFSVAADDRVVRTDYFVVPDYDL